MKPKRSFIFPVAVVASLGLVAAVIAVFWLAPNRLVQVHESSIQWNGADPVEIAFEQSEANPIVRVDLIRAHSSDERAIRTFPVPSPSVAAITFDGWTQNATPAPPGVYTVRLHTSQGPAETKSTNKATDVVMGFSSKIFYFHVGSAMVFLCSFIGCALLSLTFLFLRRSKAYRALARTADHTAHAMAEIGVVFSLIVLITGPIWAKPNWGVFWTWEPRLLLTLLTSFLFVGYLVLRNYAGTDDAGKRMSAGIAVIGLPAAYFIHVAVDDVVA